MGHIQKRNGKYRLRWIDPDTGKEKSATFTVKAKAESRLHAIEAAKDAGTYIDTSSKITVGEYAREYLASRPHRESTATNLRYAVEKHIAGTSLGALRLASVRKSQVQAWASGRSQILGASTVRVLVGTLRSIFAAAVEDRLMPSNPAMRLSLPRSESERIVPLTIAQVQALAEAMPARCRAMVITQAATGLRIAELLSLRVEDVDFLRRTVRVEWQLTRDGKRRVDPKTPRSRRTVPLPDVVGQALSAHIASFAPAEDGSLFTTVTGNRYRSDHYSARIFAPAVAASGLPAHTTSHDLRHHYASVLLDAGESVITVAERLGHESATLVLKTYGHLMPDTEDRTRRAIDAAWSDGQMTASAHG